MVVWVAAAATLWAMRTLLLALALTTAVAAGLPAASAEPGNPDLAVTAVGDGTVTVHNPTSETVTVDAAAVNADGQPVTDGTVVIPAGADTVAFQEAERPFLPVIDGKAAGPPISPQATPTLSR